MNRLSRHCGVVARSFAWIGILAILALSIVPADERPLSGFGARPEHFAAFALVYGAFAIGYDLSLGRLILFALLFCGGIELIQIPLPTRHARVSDFIIDFVGSCFAFTLVHIAKKYMRTSRRSETKAEGTAEKKKRRSGGQGPSLSN